MIVAKDKVVNLKHVTLNPSEIVTDYRIGYRSRQASLIGRMEVMGGKAKFGIFGDGKEVPQLAMARAFQKGDFRSGYYRDQTFMLALGDYTLHQFFAQLFAHADVEAEPATAGRSMNAHFATRFLDGNGKWRDQTGSYNSASDISPTGSQMPRLVGLGYASRLYRELEELRQFTSFSNQGNEIAFGTIGNATCAEGMFWEAVNAIAVLRAPVILSVWDDDYGISVSNEHQVAKSISELLKGFQRKKGGDQGFDLYVVKGWDYPALVETYQKAAKITRQQHIPSFIHVQEVTQPQGHSTSGSHERYKSAERLEWEREYDCLRKMREWMIEQGIASEEKLAAWEEEDKETVVKTRDEAWQAYTGHIRKERDEVVRLLNQLETEAQKSETLTKIRRRLEATANPIRKDCFVKIREALFVVRNEELPSKQALIEWKREHYQRNLIRYGSHLTSESASAVQNIEVIDPVYSENPKKINGFEILNACFEAALARDPRIIAFGEDVGKLGDVNQGFRGLQSKYGELRVSDTGIRECTIVGQAIGLAMRGLRPIAEIQYLDYILYGLQIMSDDLATLHWRTKGGQAAPVIIRTRGHRLEGIWHSGSPMAGLIHLVRGMHVLVPRNMTQAAGFYNLLLQADDPAVVIEVLNGYRIKEELPDNIDSFTVPVGVPEILRPGKDVTIVTYGACCRIAMEAAGLLSEVNIDAEIIDVQSLLPFDVHGLILESLQKTNRIIFVDEDVPGGTTAYMMQQVIEEHGGYRWLDSMPCSLPARPHRPAYGTDGDYFSKPNVEEVFEAAYNLMHEANPGKYPIFF